MVHGLFFCATLTRRRGGHTSFVQTGAETSDTGVKAVKPDSRCSWEGQSRKVGAGVGDESTESRSVVQPLRIPLVIRPPCRTSVVVVRWTGEMFAAGRLQMGVPIWGAVHSHSMDKWAQSGAGVQTPWHGVLEIVGLHCD